MKIAGFDFGSSPEHIELQKYNPETLQDCSDAVSNFVMSLGGQVNDPNKFDPFKAGVSSTTGERAIPGDATKSGMSKMDKVTSEIKRIQKQRVMELESKVDDREITVYNQ